MKKALETSFLAILLFACISIGLGFLLSGARPFETKISQATADTIAKEKADEEIKQMQKNGEAERITYYILGASVVILILTPLSTLITIATYSAWIRRHDRKPNKQGNLPAVPAKSSLVDLNTGMRTDTPASENLIAQTSKNKAFASVATALTGSGRMFAGNARRRETMIEDQLWPGEEEPPEQTEIEPVPEIGVHVPEMRMLENSNNQW